MGLAQRLPVMAEDCDSQAAGMDELSARNFARLAEYIFAFSGIKMPASKRTMLEGRLRRLMRTSGAITLDDYCTYLFEEGGMEREQVDLFDAVTTNKTDFFREPAHFDFLTDKVLPVFTAERRSKIKIWSAACSIGAEAYTTAMVLEEYGRVRGRFDYKIFGTDLSTRVLDQARAGRFAEAMIEPVPDALRQRYLLKSRDPRKNEVRIIPQIRARHAFGRLNLMDESYPIDRDMDVIFCRNVLIYFDKPTQAKVLKRLSSHLRPGGYLFLGHSESISGIELPCKPVANTVIQRV